MLLTVKKGLSELSDEQCFKYLSDCVRYEESSGKLYWRDDRPVAHFKTKGWQAKWLNKHGNREAGSLDVKGSVRGIHINHKKYLTHRVVFLLKEGEWPRAMVDHINGDRRDNRWINLRHATPQINSKNVKKYSTNTSGVMGVTWHKSNKKWIARGCYTFKGKQHRLTLGYYKDIKDAERAVQVWREYQGGYTERHGK